MAAKVVLFPAVRVSVCAPGKVRRHCWCLQALLNDAPLVVVRDVDDAVVRDLSGGGNDEFPVRISAVPIIFLLFFYFCFFFFF